MGLPVRQRRVLGRIEGSLRGSDPRLAGLYSIFARLTRDEDMPRLEQLRHGAVVVLGRVRLRLVALGSRVFGRLIPKEPAVLLLPLAVCAAIASIALALSFGGGPNCSPVKQAAAASKYAPPSRLCRSETPMGMYVGHLVLVPVGRPAST